MAIRKMYYLIVVLLGVASVSCGPEDERPCCPASQYVVMRNGVHHCLDTSTNATIPKLNLTCKNETLSKQNYDTANQKYYVDSYGQLFVQKVKNTKYEGFPSGEYCFGTVTSMKKRNIQIPTVVVCPEHEKVSVIGGAAIGICMIISSAFLLLTAAIYFALPELRDLQGKSIINLCVSLGLGFAILGDMKLHGNKEYAQAECAIRVFVVYFFIIAAFFWMNVIAIQIFLKIRNLDISRPLMSTKWKDHKKEFLRSALYAWGLPVVFTAVMAIVNYVPGDHIKPGIGIIKCWFHDIQQQWLYMYSVMTILITINSAIFVYASTRLCSSTFSSKHVKLVRYRFWMTVRLCLVMGLSWIFEMISSLFSHVAWEILNVINALQGVILFVVLIIFRRRVLKSMYNHGWLRCCNGPVESFLARGEDVEDEVEHTTLGNPLDSVQR